MSSKAANSEGGPSPAAAMPDATALLSDEPAARAPSVVAAAANRSAKVVTATTTDSAEASAARATRRRARAAATELNAAGATTSVSDATTTDTDRVAAYKAALGAPSAVNAVVTLPEAGATPAETTGELPAVPTIRPGATPSYVRALHGATTGTTAGLVTGATAADLEELYRDRSSTNGVGNTTVIRPDTGLHIFDTIAGDGPDEPPIAGGLPPTPSKERPNTARRSLIAALVVLALIAVGVTVDQLAFGSGTTASGYLEPTTAAYLNFGQPGTVSDVLVRAGDHVRAGEVLAEQDSTNLEAKLAADQATLYADRARVIELGGPLGATQQAEVTALVNQANQTLATAQAKASGTVSSAQSKVSAASARVQAAQLQLAQDNSTYASDITACSAPGRTQASVPTDQQCLTIEHTIADDQSAVTNENESLSQAQLALTNAQNAASQQLNLANTQAAVVAARDDLTGAVSTNSTEEASADAAVSRDVANVASDETAIEAAQVIAPVAGIVGSVGADVGDYATTNGIRTYETGGQTTTNNSFNLFSQAAQSSGSNTSPGENPVVTVYSSDMEVTVQVSERTVTQLTVGQGVKVSVSAVHAKDIAGSIADIEPSAVNKDGKVYYLVDLNIDQTQLSAKVLPGMTANVTFDK